jgi:hypothetical protein
MPWPVSLVRDHKAIAAAATYTGTIDAPNVNAVAQNCMYFGGAPSMRLF